MTTQFAAIYAPLISVWNGTGAVPAGYSGSAFAGAGDTAANKLAAINSWVATTGATYQLVPSYRVLNACDKTDLAALTSDQKQQLAIVTGSGLVDPTPGNNQVAILANIFAGKSTTLNALVALQAAAKSAPMWWAQNGLPWAPTLFDVVAAWLVPNNATMWNYTAQNKRRAGFNIAVDILYAQTGSDYVTATGPTTMDAGFGSTSLADGDVNLQALKRIVNVLLPGDAALAALTSS